LEFNVFAKTGAEAGTGAKLFGVVGVESESKNSVCDNLWSVAHQCSVRSIVLYVSDIYLLYFCMFCCK